MNIVHLIIKRRLRDNGSLASFGNLSFVITVLLFICIPTKLQYRHPTL